MSFNLFLRFALILSACFNPILYGQTTLLSENFEGSSFPPTSWTTSTLSGQSAEMFWSRATTSAFGAGNGAAKYNFWNSPQFTEQALTSPLFDPISSAATLKFDHAYAGYNDFNDRLRIEYSINGGSTWSTLRTMNGGNFGDLVTAPPTTIGFVPTNSQWATKNYSIPSGTDKLRFVAISANGNNLYLDNISVTSGSPPAAPTLVTPSNGATNQSLTPTLTWNSVTGATSYRLQVSYTSGFTSIVQDYSNIETNSKTLPTALLDDTQYYWRVNANNNAGSSSYSSIWTFTTSQVSAPASPTLLTPTDGATNQSLTPTLTWNSVSGATSYRLQVSTDNGFSSPVYDESELTTTSRTLPTSLSKNTLYYWRVNAKNAGGTSSWSQHFSFTTIKPSILLITHNGDEDYAAYKTCQIRWSSQFVDIVKLEYSTNTGGFWTTIVTLNSDVQSYNWEVPSNSVSSFCMMRISDQSDPSINDVSNGLFTIFIYPSVLQLNKQFSFSVASENSYRMVGIPGNESLIVTYILTGEQKTEWNAYSDIGIVSTNKDDYLIEHSAANPIRFTFGRGFWLLSKSAVTISKQVVTPVLDDNNYVLVPLQSDWNIITNPFDRSVQWSRVVTVNNITLNPLLYSFNGSWNNNTATMTPYEGYYFNNSQNLQKLKIPYNPDGPLTKESLAPLPLKISDNKISISLFQGGTVKSTLIAVIDSASSEDFDSTDYFAPPASFEDVSIIIKNQNLGTAYKSLFAESRPMKGEGQIFDLQLKNVTGAELKFDFTGVEKFKEYEVYLFDARLKKYYNLKEPNSILSPAYVKEGKFSLLIGKSSFIDSEKEKNTVNEFTLLQNYPNPFNPKTVIMYSLKAPSNVVLTVYDITGSTVAKLVDEYLLEGYHETVFNADNLSSGIYIYRLEVKKGNTTVYTSSKKMVVAK